MIPHNSLNGSKGYRICTDGRKIVISWAVKFLEDKDQDIIKNTASIEDRETLNINNSQTKLQFIEDNIDNVGNMTENQDANLDTMLNVSHRSNRLERGVSPDRFTFLTNKVKTEDTKNWDDIKNMQNPFEKKR